MAIHIQRREFIGTVGGAMAWPLAARAQQPKMPVIGFLSPGTSDADTSRMNAVRQGLKETGFVEGQNFTIEYRGAQSQYDQLPALVADLVSRQVAVIIAVAFPATLAAKAATNTIPIVFVIGIDPVEAGLVASLNRPGGNATGVNFLSVAVIGKRLELLHELLPIAGVIAYLANPRSVFTEVETKALRAAGRTLGTELRVLNASTDSEIDTAFASLPKDHSVPLVISGDPTFTNQRSRLVMLAARHTIPAIYSYREFVAAGGLMSYGPDFADAYRQAGVYAGRIFKGAKPSDLPVQQAVKIELVINLKTAKVLGLTMPTALLVRADEVID